MKDRIGIVGGGISGISAARLASKKGYDVFLSEYGNLTEEHRAQLVKEAIPFEEGVHSDRILDSHIVIKSPGVPQTASIIKMLRQKEVPVISEIEFAFQFSNSKIVAITGSNGKTTTASLLHHILKCGGIKVGLGGNIGKAFSELVIDDEIYDWYVLELSSFQLEDCFAFKADIAILLNITPDHLDRYDHNFDKYVEAKFNIVRNQTAKELFIFNGKDPAIEKMVNSSDLSQRMIPVSDPIVEASDLHLGGFIHFKIDKFSLKGKHNLFNASCALMAAMELNLELNHIQKALNSFVNVPHRIEFVRDLKGVSFYNDSKATNVDAVFYALDAIEKPIIWIAGGKDKGNNYSQIKDLVSQKVKALICLGKDNSKLLTYFGEIVDRISDTQDMGIAIEISQKIANPGDSVLLSPACASFDLFDNYEHRGNLFKDLVQKLN